MGVSDKPIKLKNRMFFIFTYHSA